MALYEHRYENVFYGRVKAQDCFALRQPVEEICPVVAHKHNPITLAALLLNLGYIVHSVSPVKAPKSITVEFGNVNLSENVSASS